MSVDDKILALIHADIDGELSADERETLTAALTADPDAAKLHKELRDVAALLADEAEVEPPASLRKAILDATLIDQISTKDTTESAPGILQTLLGTSVLRYAATFAAGAIIAAAVLDSGQIANDAFRDVTGLVGTVGDEPAQNQKRAGLLIDRTEITGKVTLRSERPLTIVDFDVNTSGPIDIVARYRDRSVWFNGFAQLESPATDLSIGQGEVRVRIHGKRRYALYLHNAGDRAIQLELEFFKDGESIHKATLTHGESG